MKKLREAIKEGEVTLTNNEKTVLEVIRSEGGYYEEGFHWDETPENVDQTFFGWGLTDRDVRNKFHVNGVIASLVKKGVLKCAKPDDEGCVAVYICYALEFDKSNRDRILFDYEAENQKDKLFETDEERNAVCQTITKCIHALGRAKLSSDKYHRFYLYLSEFKSLVEEELTKEAE